MRTAAPQTPPVALTIAGSDSGGGAGIQADLTAMAATGVFGTSVLTAVTAQNTQGVQDAHLLAPAQVRAQAMAVFSDFDVRAVKTGMLGNRAIIETVSEVLADRSLPVIVDPVMIAESGDRLLDADAEPAYRELLATATLTTPNVPELAALTGRSIDDADDALAAGKTLLDTGVDAVLVKGGHLDSDPVSDWLVTPETVTRFEHPRVDTDAGHGSGCVLSSRIAAQRARGLSLRDAVEESTTFMEQALRYHYAVGGGAGPVNPLIELRSQAARAATIQAVRSIATEVVTADMTALVPEVGMNVVGAVPGAESLADIAGIEGRITRRVDGVGLNGSVRFAGSEHTGRFLLGLREDRPAARFAVACRLDAAVREAVRTQGFSTVETGSRDSIQANAQLAVERAEQTPTTVFYDGGEHMEPICFLIASDPDRLIERLHAIHSALPNSSN